MTYPELHMNSGCPVYPRMKAGTEFSFPKQHSTALTMRLFLCPAIPRHLFDYAPFQFCVKLDRQPQFTPQTDSTLFSKWHGFQLGWEEGREGGGSIRSYNWVYIVMHMHKCTELTFHCQPLFWLVLNFEHLTLATITFLMGFNQSIHSYVVGTFRSFTQTSDT